MEIKIIKPRESLKKYFQYIWYLDMQGEKSNDKLRLIPTGFSEILFHYNDGYGRFIKGGNDCYSSTVIIGQQENYYDYLTRNNNGIISFVINPLYVSEITGFPASDFANSIFDAELVFNKEIKNINDFLCGKTSVTEKIDYIERYFELILGKKKIIGDKIIEQSFQNIKSSGGFIKIKELAEFYNISNRQLERKYLNKIGLTPKKISKIIKLQYVLYLAQTCTKSKFTDLALNSNYYDQSHFINEFKSLTGYSPKEYFNLCSPVSDFYSTGE